MVLHGSQPDEELRRKHGLGATGAYPQGRLGPHDQGEIKCAIAADPTVGRVRIEFGKPVAWLALTPEQAIGLAEKLIDKAKQCWREQSGG